MYLSESICFSYAWMLFWNSRIMMMNLVWSPDRFENNLQTGFTGVGELHVIIYVIENRFEIITISLPLYNNAHRLLWLWANNTATSRARETLLWISDSAQNKAELASLFFCIKFTTCSLILPDMIEILLWIVE